jgi:DNA polymerase III subunit beta
MKFTVSLSEFSKVLNKVLPAIPRKSTLPVLEHLNFSLTGDDLQIVATDQDIIIKAIIIVEGSDDGGVLIPARRLSEIVKALDNIGSITFESSHTNYDIKISTIAGNYDMKGLDPDEYLQLPELFESEKPDMDSITANPEQNIAYFNNQDILKLTNKTIFAVSTDEFRAAMTGVLFQFRTDYVNAVSTDSFRLVKVMIEAIEQPFPEDFDVIIPARAVDILRKVETDVIMSSIDNYGKITHLRFDMDNLVFICRVIDERFPPYETVIPQNNNLIVETSRKDFLSAIKRVAIFTSAISHQIRMEITANQLIMRGEDEESGSKGIETLKCDFNGENMVMGFNFKYLEEAIANLDHSEGPDDSLFIFVSEQTKPVLVSTNRDEKSVLMLLMPVRITSPTNLTNEAEA